MGRREQTALNLLCAFFPVPLVGWEWHPHVEHILIFLIKYFLVCVCTRMVIRLVMAVLLVNRLQAHNETPTRGLGSIIDCLSWGHINSPTNRPRHGAIKSRTTGMEPSSVAGASQFRPLFARNSISVNYRGSIKILCIDSSHWHSAFVHPRTILIMYIIKCKLSNAPLLPIQWGGVVVGWMAGAEEEINFEMNPNSDLTAKLSPPFPF